MEPTDKKLLGGMRDAIRLKQYSIRTEEAYTNCIKRYTCSHTVCCHPAEIDAPEVCAVSPSETRSRTCAATSSRNYSCAIWQVPHNEG